MQNPNYTEGSRDPAYMYNADQVSSLREIEVRFYDFAKNQ